MIHLESVPHAPQSGLNWAEEVAVDQTLPRGPEHGMSGRQAGCRVRLLHGAHLVALPAARLGLCVGRRVRGERSGESAGREAVDKRVWLAGAPPVARSRLDTFVRLPARKLRLSVASESRGAGLRR